MSACNNICSIGIKYIHNLWNIFGNIFIHHIIAVRALMMQLVFPFDTFLKILLHLRMLCIYSHSQLLDFFMCCWLHFWFQIIMGDITGKFNLLGIGQNCTVSLFCEKCCFLNISTISIRIDIVFLEMFLFDYFDFLANILNFKWLNFENCYTFVKGESPYS